MTTPLGYALAGAAAGWLIDAGSGAQASVGSGAAVLACGVYLSMRRSGDGASGDERRNGGGRRRYGRITVLIGLAGFAFGLVAAWARLGDDLRWRARELMKVLAVAPAWDLRICRCAPDSTVTFERSDGLRIVAGLYRAELDGRRPGIVLVHGNMPIGHRLPMYGVLARRLAERGYDILAIDRTGYGESADPFRLGSVDALDDAHDVRAAMEFLAGLDDVDDRVHLIGHSGGAVSVFDVGLSHAAAGKVVAIGPPRRETERLLDPADREYFWNRARRTHRQVYGHELPAWYTREVWLARAFETDMAHHLPELSATCHAPLLLIDGEREAEADKRYLADYADRIAEPKRYVTIERSNHYANTVNFFWTVYDARVVRRTVGVVDEWLRRSEDGASGCR